MRNTKNVMFGVLALLVSVVAVGLVYAGFTQTLNINGTGNVTASKWDIHFDNLSSPVKTGTTQIVTPAEIKTGRTQIGDYEVVFATPGDSLMYTFDIVNEGDFDASITSLTKNSPECTGTDSTSNTNVCKNLDYQLIYISSGKGYSVGDAVSEGDTLAKGEVRKVRLTLKLNKNMPANELASSDVLVGGLGITILYSQGSNYGGNPELQETNIAMFLPGSDVNVKFKKLANPSVSNITRSTTDTNITSIQRSNTLSITPTDDNIVSTSESNTPIYAWFDNGTLYLYSESENLYLNEDSSNMFRAFDNLTNIDLSTIDTSKVTNMQAMFADCDILTTIDLSNFNTSNVENMKSMFALCISLESLDLSNFDTSNVTNMTGMFMGHSSIGAMSLKSLDLSSFNTSNVTDMSYMFQRCSSLTTLDLSNFDTSNVTNMSGMFNNCSSLTTLDLSGFDTSNVTNMSGMFENCTSIKTLNGLQNWDVSNVTNMNNMFRNCRGIKTLNGFQNWDVSNVTDMGSMFRNCSGIKTLNGLQNWDVSKVTNFSEGNDKDNSHSEGMFEGLTSLTDASAINNWNIKPTAYFNNMFKSTPVHPEFTKVNGTWDNGTFIVSQ